MKERSYRRMHAYLAMLLVAIPVIASGNDRFDNGKVKIWQETLTLPTYFTDPAEESPIFFENKSYQGASRVAYPYPVQDDLTMIKGKQDYTALYLENEYIKLCVLPEIGGRLFYATDKTNGYELFYRQSVVKPMLIGMLGAWISGGVEFCVFHHHRASTHMPVEYKLESNPDGSATIWIGEFEPRHRMRWSLGISLYPGRSWVRVDGNLINPTANTNSFLYWANVAVHVNNDYQVIFPPSTQYATYHAKKSFAHWPITSETYNGHEYYQDNIDASWYRNHPMSGSFFAHDIDQGIVAGYDHGAQAGTMHVANHHIVPGAKLWQWGVNSTFDRKALTDNDGPYAEVMVGAYSDNQPDYSWIKPYEVKQFQQTWYPLRETRGMKNGNLDAAVNLEIDDKGNAFIAANTTMPFKDISVFLEQGEKVIFRETVDIDPATPFSREVSTDGNADKADLKLSLVDSSGREVISYQPELITYNPDLPPVVTPPDPPESYATTEELYLVGERIRQFHNARIDPELYFREALRRDPLDVRCNTMMGIIRHEQGDYESAKEFFEKAISRLTANYTRPRTCEALYHIGVILQKQGRFDEAIDYLYRAVWDYEFRAAAYFQLAQIYSTRNNPRAAMEAISESLAVNGQNVMARNLKVSLLRRMGRNDEAARQAQAILELDPLSYYAHNELSLLPSSSSAENASDRLMQLLRNYPENFLELASSYMDSGLYTEAEAVLDLAISSKDNRLSSYPTLYYYLGYLRHLNGDEAGARANFNTAQKLSIKYCFPFRLESMKVYEVALQYNPKDSRALYFLGNLLYDKQPEKAIAYWEEAVRYEPGLAMAHRNLGWGYNQTFARLDDAINAYMSAISNDPTQPRFYAEFDMLMELANAPIAARLKLLTDNHENLEGLQSAVIREVMVLILAGDYQRAIELMDGRAYYRQEGVNIIHDLHVDAHLLLGREYLRNGNAQQALEQFRIADTYPENQMIERPEAYDRNPQVYYFSGLAHEALGDDEMAAKYFTRAVSSETDDDRYLYYKAMAMEKSGDPGKAKVLLANLIRAGEEQLQNDGAEVDFFAKFGEDLSDSERVSNAYHLMGLGHLGAGESGKATDAFKKALEANVNQLWSRIYLTQ